ncbi:MAG: aminotransferase class I/II-fold pyridoxal phosphate-dependent enzyme [Clostridia bacterium]|nr:aminotransferase class I/II-fold pyridoxal phosphate-dependent enzyme [Clostridia bacterium]
MKPYSQFTKEELIAEKDFLIKKYKEYQDLKLTLNMARGKPGADQLELSMPMMKLLQTAEECIDANGVDTRNYGELLGIKEARKLFGDVMGIKPEETIVVGSSSLTFMWDTMVRAMLLGVRGSEKPWSKYDKVKFICPVPGYDRHFTICETLGIEMIPVELTEWGPDMDAIRELVKDESVKGIWCVPKYTNPLGGCYSDEAVKALASMETAAKDFRIFWDNAYCVHYVYKDVPLLNMLEECKKAGNPDRVFMFGSTSKITFPGAGVGFFGASEENVEFIKNQITASAISWDKINMLRHVRFFKDVNGIHEIMAKHAEILRPKFDAVLNTLDEEIGPRGAGRWVKPEGGYFVTFIAEKGCAKRINLLCKEAGLSMTGAGATHPYHKDPDDAYLRIAPSFPEPSELKKAMDVFCIAVRLATVEKILDN